MGICCKQMQVSKVSFLRLLHAVPGSSGFGLVF
jgi:hypothetical protein